jgi:hypothetical protein
MGATVFFQNAGGNDIATLGMTFQVNNVNADPTAVTCVITDPTGAATTHTVGAGPSPADITKLSTGVYQLLIGSTIVGMWSFQWTGTGTASELDAGTWTVNPAGTIHQFYTSVEELKSRLNITDTVSDFELELAVQAAARAVESYCGRFFYQIAETRTYVPYDLYELPVDDLVSVTSMATDQDGDGVFEQSWVAGTDFQLSFGIWEFNANVTGEARPYTHIRAINAVGGGKFFPYTWPFSRLDRIQIVGVWGWPAVPYRVKQAALQIASELFKLKDSPFGLAGTSEFGMVRLPRGGNPYVASLLCDYASPMRKVGM